MKQLLRLSIFATLMMRRITSVLTVLVFACWASIASAIPITDVVTVGGNQWAQPDQFTSLSLNDIFLVCGTGTCNGDLTSDSGTYTMNGWTWANVDMVNGLFNSYIAAGGGSTFGYPLTGPSVASQAESIWAPSFILDFRPTLTTDILATTVGWVISVDRTTGYEALIVDDWRPFRLDFAQTINEESNKDYADPAYGGWFTRTAPSEIPIPGTLFLLGLGLLGLRISRLRAI